MRRCERVVQLPLAEAWERAETTAPRGDHRWQTDSATMATNS
ncbi:hypothetical protein SAMN05660209_00784 [Geodermatophilus africanus]|uniref:Uncharacterized protein n=1 Tax=Geodermatophilus africanus TaxID=1137993 RepID=A0A1H3CXN3_9ACTN|nr:hypothetical protein SAMN05660209_00784 [Geodermatophilus africanus]